MIDEIFKFAMRAGIFAGFCFLIYTNLSPKRNDKSVVYLNFFVLFFTLNNLQITLADYQYIDLNFFERKLLIPWYALIIPAFYTFVTYYLKAENKVKSFVGISMILFALEIVIRLVLGNYFYNETNNVIVARYAKYEEILNLSYTIFLFLKVIYIFMQQSKYYEEIASYDNMKWFKKFLLYGFGIIFFWVFAVAFNFNEVLSPNIPVYYPLRFASTLLIFWVAYYGFFRYNILIERIEIRKDISNDGSQKELFTVDVKSSSFLLIENVIIDKKLFLDPDLYVEIVAKAIHFAPKKVSETIKETTKLSFSDYINSLRVEKAKKYLISQKYSNYTIVSIGLECGFNSKTTFYNAFKKFVKMSPSEFRLKNQK